MLKANKHLGSSLQEFFEELGEWEEVEALAKEKILQDVNRVEVEEAVVNYPVLKDGEGCSCEDRIKVFG